MAIWSNIPDMLILSRAILDRFDEEKRGNDFTEASEELRSPLRQIGQITSHKFHVTDDTINENTYGFGWARHKDDINGRESRPRLTLYHGGQVTRYLNSIYLFPETKSAVTVLTNAQSAGDCSDLVAQMFIQSLFEMKPEVDFEIRGKKVSTSSLAQYTKMMDDLQHNQKLGAACLKLEALEGLYWNEDLRGLIEVYKRSKIASQLEMRQNKIKTQRHHLSHYQYDTFSFMPESRDEMELRCLVDYSVYDQFLISFVHDEEDRIIGLERVMQEGFKPLRYNRM